MLKKYIKYLLFSSVLLFLVAACSNEEADVDGAGETQEASVVTSFYPVYEIVNEIAGDRLDISLMIGEGEDAHHYEPSAQAVASVNEADAFIYSSDIMEFWAEDLLSVVENEDLQVLEMAENVDLALSEEEHEHSHSHSHETDQTITIEGVADHYHTEDVIELTATHNSDYDHWHWFTREPESEEWVVVEDQFSNEFTGVATINGQEIKAELYDNDHNVVAESEPVIITIDDHEGEHSHDHDHDHESEENHDHNHEVQQTVSINGVAGHYHTGDLIELNASHDSDHNHWHWFTREPNSEEWVMVEDQLSDSFSSVANIDGLEVKAELYDDNHNVVAESEPVTITIDDHEKDHSHEGDSSETLDPHFWLDPVAVKEILPSIVEVLSVVDPEGAEIYQENADRFSEALQELDVAYQEAFEGANNRSFVVQHQAFGHLANRYDLEQVSVGGMMTEIEPDPEALVNVVEFVRENDIPVVYYQSGENSSTAETIANETDTEVATLYDLEKRPVEDDFEENVYIEAMYHNLEQLQKSVQ